MLAVAASVAMLATAVPAVAQAAQNASITRDGARVTMCGDEYCATLETGDGVFVSSLVVGGAEMLEGSKGLRTSVTTAAGAVTSRETTGEITIEEQPTSISVSFGTSLVDETWTFGVEDAALTLDIERTFKAWTALTDQGTPTISLASDAVDNIRWPGDGGNLPVGGDRLESFQTGWLAAGQLAAPNIRTAKRQMDYTLLSESSNTALSITGTTSYDDVRNGRATEVRRSGDETESLDVSVIMSSGGLGFAGGNPLGYAVSTTKDGSPIFLPVGANAGQTDTVSLTFAPASFEDHYDLGQLAGVNERELSRVINDYARWMMQDYDMGASTEQPQLQSEVPPLEMHWIGEMIEVFGSDAAIESYKEGLQDIHDHMTEASGRVFCCHPGWGPTWGHDYGDHIPSYVLGLVQAYRLSGDAEWLEPLRARANLSIDYLLANWTDPQTHFVRNVNPNVGEPDYDNDYWESSTGTFNGYTTALLYDALTSWAQLESDVFASDARAASLREVAGTIKTNYNRAAADGGFWSEASHTFLYGTGNQDALYLPVNAAVLKTDIADAAREQAIVTAIRQQNEAGNYDLNPMNVQDLYLADTVSRTAGKGGENGGWYGIPEGDFYAGLALIDDPSVLQTAITSFLTRYQVDGFYGSSTYDRADPTLRTGAAQFFPLTALPARGLYRYGYGFQPGLDRLVLAPHISAAMQGSRVDYRWRGVDMSVAYDSIHDFGLTFEEPSPTPVTVEWGHQAPGSTVQVSVTGQGSLDLTVDENGTAAVELPAGIEGSVAASCSTCVAPPLAEAPSERAISQVDAASGTMRDDLYGQVGVQIAVGPAPVEVSSLGRFKVSGNADIHRVKLLDVDGAIVASGVVDMSHDADADGFVTARLSESVLLEPGIYYAVSVETVGGDSWMQEATVGVSGEGITVLGAVTGRNLDVVPGALGNGATIGYTVAGEPRAWIQELVSPESMRAASGEEIVIDATVFGQAEKHIRGTVTVSGPEGWEAETKPFKLKPKGDVVSETVSTTVKVPDAASTGVYSLTVTATTDDGLVSEREVVVSVSNILFDFDDGTTQGWQAGDGVTEMRAVTTTANGPGSPYAGSHALEFFGRGMTGPDPRTISVVLDEPIDLTNATELYAFVNSYGAWPHTPDSYQATITLHSGSESISQTTDYDANTWNRAAVDVSGWEYRNAITAIDVTYVVNVDAQGYSLGFDLDSVGFDLSGAPASPARTESAG
ncbi:hypothetical protein HF576_05185 [Microbacterium sp. CFH 90308]|uniref:Alpha-L-rhamnosidase six-hairpin glycosidase domain-containing protein n=1 Tax=Microbacterium salsuginis TaxID=2722803 RepID=A0ABX1K8A9_9MICO|nr:hypothetical protein [Microbacterium sp. CFH 90308]NLP83232.1 hypothetical protein [Microbacterium sp. CFH 90308]